MGRRSDMKIWFHRFRSVVIQSRNDESQTTTTPYKDVAIIPPVDFRILFSLSSSSCSVGPVELTFAEKFVILSIPPPLHEVC